ncbi:MAG TPA: vWA domain-containing protein [Thermoanaerobaculia bacterium]|nr:vWA domain-containing protein [Thermoanaerobaculia bacterium]
MAVQSNDKLRTYALEALARQFEGKKAEIVLEESETIPSAKKTIYRFVVGASDEANGPRHEVVLDEAGEVVDLASLAAAEGRDFFLPAAATVTLPATTVAKLVTIDPKVNDFQLSECGFRERITVTVPPQAIRQKIDVYFLADNTGSMGGAIANVKAGAATILNTLAGTGLDIQYGVGNYRDFTDPQAFTHQLDVTPSQPAVLAAINGWFASGGFDTPEAQLFALQEVAKPTVPKWRGDALKFIVWFGDNPGHEPICKAIWGGPFDITRATVIAALNANVALDQPTGIAVLAISVDSGGSDGLDGPATDGYPGCPSNGLTGQATSITSATGGSLALGVNPTNVAQAILDALIKVVQIKNVNLVPAGAIASFVTSITPVGGYGPLDPTKTHKLGFDVVFERGFESCALRDQIFEGEIRVVMDGAIVARKPTKITIPKCRYHYVAKFVCGVVREVEEGCYPLRPGRYATEINIYNGHCAEAVIRKRVTPVVLDGAAIGREPQFGKMLAEDKIALPPQTATMDDCCRLAELLHQPVRLDGPLMVGFLEIDSNVPLTVTAVYTANGLCGGSVSVDVEQIAEVRK